MFFFYLRYLHNVFCLETQLFCTHLGWYLDRTHRTVIFCVKVYLCKNIFVEMKVICFIELVSRHLRMPQKAISRS